MSTTFNLRDWTRGLKAYGPPSPATASFERQLALGFARLRFAPNLETRYQQSKSLEGLKDFQLDDTLVFLLSLLMLLSDWLMIPDQITNALAWRVGVFLPAIIFAQIACRFINAEARDWLIGAKSILASAITAGLCVKSHDHLAPPYLVALTVFVMLGGSVLKATFVKAAVTNAFILFIFGVAAACLVHPPWSIVIPVALMLISTAAFSLHTVYWLEWEDRKNWLLSQHENSLQLELEESNAHLEQVSRSDLLTGIANRRHLDLYLEQSWTRAKGHHHPLALLMIDIDHFKQYNDYFGHLAGDDCLKIVTQAMNNALRKPGNLLARFGGEEFAVVLNHTTFNQANATAQRLRKVVEECLIQQAPSCGPHVTVSIGLAYLHPSRLSGDFTHAIAAADAALYEAKTQGRNRVRAFDAEDCAAFDPQPAAPGDTSTAPLSSLVRSRHRECANALEDDMPWLHFAPPLEAQYLRDSAAHRLRFGFLSGLLALLVFNGFLIVDYFMIPDVFRQSLEIRLGLFTPIAIATLTLMSRYKAWVLAHLSPQQVEIVIFFSGLLSAICILAVVEISHNPLAQFYSVGLVIVAIYGNNVQRLRFWYACAFSAAALVIQVTCMATAPVFDRRLNVPMLMLMFAIIGFSMVSNYALDRDVRRRYLLSKRRKQLLDDINHVHEQLENLTRTDGLTGIYNRRYFQEYLQQIWQRSAYDRSALSIIILDVDHFKRFNDRYGHPSGDQCLKLVANAISNCLNNLGDVVARFGGEEFVVVLPHSDSTQAQLCAQRILAAVRALQIPHQASSTAAVVTASLGVGSCLAQSVASPSDLLSVADAALYKAKEQGRNRVICDSLTSVKTP